MLAIKLKRIGKKHQPSFRVIVAEKRLKMSGRYVEDLGWLDPKSKNFNIIGERAKYWLEKGAQPTDSVYNLLVKSEIISGPKRRVHAKSKNTEQLKEKEQEVKK
ncbi:30S ribosomal protein S16 [Candidatus Wolfebacteria bacterium]|nr:30S ribosomal protein S16 [Candidatus Wolfebacteria bacterium]